MENLEHNLFFLYKREKRKTHNGELAVGRGCADAGQLRRLIRRPGPGEAQAGLHALRQQQLQPRQREHLQAPNKPSVCSPSC